MGEGGSLTITPDTVHLKISPDGYALWSRHFYEFSQAHTPSGFSPVPYFLLCCSIELALKGKLLVTMGTEKVRKIGHDLMKAYSFLPLTDQSLNEAELKCLEAANAIYGKKGKVGGFHYFHIPHALKGYKEYPDLGLLTAIARKLIYAETHNPFLNTPSSQHARDDV